MQTASSTSVERAIRLYAVIRRMAGDYRTPTGERTCALERGRALWTRYPEIRGANPLQAAVPEMIGFRWELKQAVDVLWPANGDRLATLDLTELTWWLAMYDTKELRGLLILVREEKVEWYQRAREADRRGQMITTDLKRLNVVEHVVESAYNDAFEAESGITPKQAREQGFNA